MNSTLLAKIAGWGQFAVQLLGSIATVGLPTNAFGWVGLLGSLATAVGVHAASVSPGTPTPTK